MCVLVTKSGDGRFHKQQRKRRGGSKAETTEKSRTILLCKCVFECFRRHILTCLMCSMLTLLLAPSVGCSGDCCPNLFIVGVCSLREVRALLTSVPSYFVILHVLNQEDKSHGSCLSFSKLDIYNNSF